MSTRARYLIKFKHGDLSCLRGRLLEDLSREHFAVLLGKTQKINGYTIINVVDLLFLARSDYNHQSVALLRIKKDFIHKALVELTNRYDVDTIIDVHTHPFTQTGVAFSATDDEDEKTFFRFLLKTQTSPENIASADFHEYVDEGREMLRFAQHDKVGAQHDKVGAQYDTGGAQYDSAVTGVDGFFNRSALALGLDVMRTIMHDQVISIVGVGGLGSVVAEHLIHMGFHEINLIDPDVLEMSNLNRVVGAYYEDAQKKRHKVDVVKRHVTQINPKATVLAYKSDVHDKEMESVLALSDWIIVATDNHASRLKVQELSVQYFVPLLSLG